MTDRHDTAMAHLKVLAEDIGPRPAGTPAHHRAESYIRDRFKDAGLQMEEVRRDFPYWRLKNAALTLNETALAIDVNPFSPACEVTAPTVAVSTLPELEAADLTGKVVLLYGELSKAPIFPINFAPIQFERDQAINRLLIEKKPNAVLAVNLHPWRRIHIFEDEDFPLPSATVSPDVGRELLANVGEDVVLHIDTQTQPSHVATIIGRAGDVSSQRIVLCAHYDTKVGTPGAADNGAGVAALLTLAEMLPGRDLPVGLEFVAWADEEYGAHTDTVYAGKYEAGFENILYAINVDGIGLLTENTTLMMMAQSEAFEQDVRGVAEDYPSVVWVDPWIQSNHATYAMRGVPCVALSSLTWERAHQADDSLDWISEAKLNEAVALVSDIITAVHTQSPSWSRG